MGTVYYVIALFAGAVFGLFALTQIAKLRNPESRNGSAIGLTIVSIVLVIAVGFAIYRFVSGLSYIAYGIGLLISFAPYIKTQADLHPDTEEEEAGE